MKTYEEGVTNGAYTVFGIEIVFAAGIFISWLFFGR